MKKSILILALFLGSLGVGLFWLSTVIEKLEDSARESGKLECRAQYEKEIVSRQKKEKENADAKQQKKDMVWIRPNSRLPALIERMRRNEL